MTGIQNKMHQSTHYTVENMILFDRGAKSEVSNFRDLGISLFLFLFLFTGDKLPEKDSNIQAACRCTFLHEEAPTGESTLPARGLISPSYYMERERP